MIYFRQFGLFVISLKCGDRSLLSQIPCVLFTGTFHALHTFPSYDTQRHASPKRATLRGRIFSFLTNILHIHTQTSSSHVRGHVRMKPTVRRKPGRESPSVFGAGEGWRQPPLILWVMRFTIVPFILFRDLLRQQRITAAPYTAYIVQRSCIGNVALPLLHHGFGSCHNLDAFFDASFVSLIRGR